MRSNVHSGAAYLCVCLSVCVYVTYTCVCVQLAEAASQIQGSSTLLSWRDQTQRLAWCIRFAPVTKRAEYVMSCIA